MSEVTLALSVALTAHVGQKDKMGKRYVDHPVTVAANCKKWAKDPKEQETLISVALLHDVLEDTKLTSEKLRMLGVSDVVIETVEAITRNEGERYFDYINRVKQNKLARIVKIEDLRHNLDPCRRAGLTSSLQKRYEKALDMLVVV